MRRDLIDALRKADSGPDIDFERLTRMLARSFDVPAAFVSLIDRDKVWFYSRFALEVEEASRDHSFCVATVETPDLIYLAVPDARADERFAKGTLVAEAPFARFLIGAPIVVHGQKIGALCAMSPEPRPGEAGGPAQLAELADLAALAGSLFELKDEARIRARMAAELIKEEWRHALTLEAGKVGSWVWDLRTGEMICNDIFRQMFALHQSRILHVEDLMATIEPADIGGVNAALAATFEQGIDYSVEFRVASSGRWLIGRGRVYQRDAAGKPLIMMGVNIDVTEARESAEQTRLLLRELNHRVKNTLAMIQSLARQTLRQRPEPQQFIDAFSGRLRTLSATHALLSDRDWSGIGLLELIHMQVSPYLLNSPSQLAILGDDLRLPPDHALGLGLILHELASNAVKFGALSTPAGELAISWTMAAGGGRVELIWMERHGPKVVPPTETGFGSRLILRSLDKVLDSSVSLSFPEDGVEARISMPLG
jgi:two-component sensor histidine kinase/GAF domain-containing protein